jgi:hypothetical protein
MQSNQIDDLVITPQQTIANIKFSQEECFNFIGKFSQHGTHWQTYPTPLNVINRIVNQTTLQGKNILVLFNVEFIDVLMRDYNIHPNRITFIADNNLEQSLVKNFYKVNSYLLGYTINSDGTPVLDKDGMPVYKVKHLMNLVQDINMKFDLVLSNPPYKDAIDIEILSNSLDVADELIFIHPSPWLYDKKNTKNTALKTRINGHVKSIQILPVNSFDGIQLPNKLDIIHIDMKYNGEFLMQEIDAEPYYFGSMLELTPASSEHLVYQPFFDAVQTFITKNGSLADHTIDISKLPMGTLELDGEWYCQLADTIGQPDRPEHYGFLLKDWTGNYGLRKTGLDSDGNPLYKIRLGKQTLESPIGNSFKFNTEEEMHNFIDALRTDFMRFCLVKVKKNKHLDSGELFHVPWLDFTQQWNDDKLFRHFNISQDIQDKIKEFIPEYYGIK